MNDIARPPQAQTLPGDQGRMRPEPQTMPRHPGSGRLAGKVAIVTGGDSGIGRAVAVLFAREGAKVAIVYLSETADADETVRLVAAEGSEAVAINGDVGDQAFCRTAVRETVERFGRLDVLVNNASEQTRQEDLRGITEDQLTRIFRSNIFGMIFMAQASLDHLGEGAAIVNTTSITSYRGQPVLVDYAATKGAITAFTRSLSQSLLKRKIRVNAVAPGPVWTPLIPASFPPEDVATFGASAPMGRAGEPNEIAPSFLFLACDDASYMTGQVLHPNGGTVVAG
jgi:NAD(P)-dependent dehydrogenase (short-subunit alcohol dehydrogenase family)